MSMKWIGALLVVAACAGAGFSKAAAHRREEKNLEQLIVALELMSSELQFRLTPLPELCRLASEGTSGPVRQIMQGLARELEEQIAPDAKVCMDVVLQRFEIPESLRTVLGRLGISLGRFDLEGQMQGVQSVLTQCRMDLSALTKDRDIRLRTYQTLGICAGLALAIALL